jgi:tRNA(Ile2) C34 agmatinyltransferase TiaS
MSEATDEKRPRTEIVKRPKDWGYKNPICPACYGEIHKWEFGKMKCPYCGTTIKVKP